MYSKKTFIDVVIVIELISNNEKMGMLKTTQISGS